MTEWEKMLAGEPYRPGDPALRAARRRARRLTHRYNGLHPDDDAGRQAVLEELLGRVGEGTVLRPPFHCDYGAQLHLGSGCFANFGLVALDVATITVGDDVQMGPNVQLLTATHPIDPVRRREGWEGGEPITIGENVWLGGGVLVLPGVTIGAGTVVGAGAVVTRDLQERVVAVGNPARVVRDIDG